ncbi:MAG: hypothetical protein AB7U60_10645, partial [Diaphorobacter sp.]
MTVALAHAPRAAALASWRDGMAYGLLGLPLAFVALPLYVVLPHHYATTLGLPLASVQRSRIVAWREGPGLVGVVAASGLSVVGGARPMLVAFAAAL